MPATLSVHAQELSTFVITVSFYDETNAPVSPSSASWTLTDRTGTKVINGRENVSIAPAETVDIVLTGNDLAITPETGRERILTIQYEYSSTAGSGLKGKDWVYFTIDDNEYL